MTQEKLEDEIQTVLWSELYKSAKSSSVATASMIRGEVIESKLCKLDGQPNHTDKAIRRVVYNRDYVINQVARAYRYVLADCTLEEWSAVCREAWQIYNPRTVVYLDPLKTEEDCVDAD